MLNFLFKSRDLGGEPIRRDLQVLDYLRKNVNFNLSHELGSLFLILICFQVYKSFGRRVRGTGNDTEGH
jgi:hypothetical protein